MTFVSRLLKLFKIYIVVAAIGSVITLNYYMRPVLVSKLPYFKDVNFHSIEEAIFLIVLTSVMTLTVLRACLSEITVIRLRWFEINLEWLQLKEEVRRGKDPDEVSYTRPRHLEEIPPD